MNMMMAVMVIGDSYKGNKIGNEIERNDKG